MALLKLKLHTWILIAMIAGTAVGALVGPDSPLMTGELVLLQKGQTPALFDGPNGARLPTPQRDLHCVERSGSDEWSELYSKNVVLRDGRWLAAASDDDEQGRIVLLLA